MTAVLWAAGQEVSADDLQLAENGHLVTPSIPGTVASSNAENYLCSFTIAANEAIAGSAYRIKAYGTFGVTGTPTLNIRPRLGGVAGTSWAQTGAQTIQSGVTNRLWIAEQILVCESTGASATWSGPLHVKMAGVLVGTAPFVNDAAEITTIIDGTSTATVDSTVALDFGLTAQWSVAAAANTITCRAFLAERLI